jgi:hypothetical protein
VQLGTHAPNARAYVSKAPHIRVIMRLQDVQTDSVVNTCKTCRHISIVRLQYDASSMDHSSGPLQCQVTQQHDTTLLTKCSVAGDKTRRTQTFEDIIYYS